MTISRNLAYELFMKLYFALLSIESVNCFKIAYLIDVNALPCSEVFGTEFNNKSPDIINIQYFIKSLVHCEIWLSKCDEFSNMISLTDDPVVFKVK